MKRAWSCLIFSTMISAMPMSSGAQDTGNAITRFDISRFDVEGNSLLALDEVRGLVAPFTGKNRTFGDVQRALEALEGAYHKRGFNLVQVTLPEQELNHGVVRFKVVETQIGKVIVEGNRNFDEMNIRRSVPTLREGEKVNIGKVSTSLRLANENPVKKTTLQLRGTDKDGEVDAVLRIEDSRPWTIGASVDNAGNASTGEHHLGLQYQHANISGRDDVLNLQYTTTLEKPSQMHVYGVGYHLPLYSLGDSLDLFASYSNVNSPLGILGLQVNGKGGLFGLRYNQNLGRDKEYESKLTYGFDYKAYENTLGTASISDVTVHPISATYTGNWTLSNGVLSYYMSAMQNIPGGSKGDSTAFSNTRANAVAAYKLLRFGTNFSHGFGNGWQFRFALNGQYTNDSLVPGEQFGAGGSTSVRGYQEREIADDVGYAALAEVYTPNICEGTSIGLAQCRLLGFVEGAHVSRNNPLPGEITSSSIGSVGLGLRLAAQKYFSVQTDFGYALRAGPVTAKGDKRVHFRVNFSY